MKLNRIAPPFFRDGRLKKYYLVMRLTWFLVLIMTLPMSASVWSQSTVMSVKLKNSTLQDLFLQIEKSSSYRFFYNNDEVDVNQRVTVDIEDKSVGKILKTALEGLPYSFKELDNKLILIERTTEGKGVSGASAQQQKTVSGKVTDTTGAPLPGVSVVVKGTASGVTTNADGSYSLPNVPGTATLQFSFVGMKMQEIVVGNQSKINVTLAEDAIGIEEVVAVGYGTQKKVNLTGALETVRVEEIKSRPLTNSSLALQGKVAGAFVSQNSGQPGNDGATILIRGVGTFKDNAPLVIVDGMESSLSDVNPKDISAISVLKDAASSAIYGNRAANGVILITTQKGNSDKMQINYTGYYGVQSVTTMPELLKGVEYLELKALAYYNTNRSWPAWYNDEFMNNYRNKVDEQRYPTDFSWVDAVFRPAQIKDNHVNLSGGNKRFQYSASIGYLDQDGVVEGNSSRKLSFRTNLSTNYLNEKLKIDLNMSGHDQITDDLVNGMEDAMYNVYVSPSTTPMKIEGYGYTWPAHSWAAREEGGYRRSNTTPVSVRMSADYEFLKGAKINVAYSLHQTSYNHEEFDPLVYTYGYKPDGSIVGTASETTSLFYMNSKSLRKTFNTNLYYTTEILKDLQMSLMGGLESREYRYDMVQASREGFAVNLPELPVGDPNSQKNNGGAYEGAWLSQLGRINLSYKDKYLFESSIRRDGSSRFIDKWGTFPSVSAGWRLSEEGFIKNSVPQISNLKLRASWGRLGNESIGQYYAASDELSLSLTTNFNNTLYPAAAVTKLANKKTSWETSEQLNFGLDFGLFNNKFTGTVEYFEKINSDILMQIPVSGTLGLSTTPYQNAAEMKNTGFELQLGYTARIKEVKLTANLTASHVKNEITNLSKQSPIILGRLIWKEGEAYNSYYGLETEGIYQSEAEIKSHLKFVDENKDGVNDINPYAGLVAYPGDIRYKDRNKDGLITLDDRDRTIIGKPFPDLTFGANLNLEWRNFDMSLFFQGVTGVNSLNQHMVTAPFHGGEAGTGAWYRDGWTEQKPSKTIQRVNSDPTRFEIVSDYYMEDASYIRLKNLELGYSIPKSVLEDVGITSLRIFANVQNAFTLTKMRYGFDPEKPSTTTSTLQYPQTRIVSAGINLKF